MQLTAVVPCLRGQVEAMRVAEEEARTAAQRRAQEKALPGNMRPAVVVTQDSQLSLPSRARSGTALGSRDGGVSREGGRGATAHGERQQEGADPETPRHHFLRACRRAHVLPEPFIIRRDASKVLSLRHYGIGNARAAPLVAALDRVPGVREVDLTGNRLSEGVVDKVVRALREKGDLAVLALSRNHVGVAGVRGLQTLVTEPAPTADSLRVLVLRNVRALPGQRVLPTLTPPPSGPDRRHRRPVPARFAVGQLPPREAAPGA